MVLHRRVTGAAKLLTIRNKEKSTKDMTHREVGKHIITVMIIGMFMLKVMII